jgi:hypothetical protein
MMTKGKGYPEHVKDTAKGFGDAPKAEVYGGRGSRSVLNEWDKSSYEFPAPKKSTQKASL